jgi:F-type H+-transporting ATPase subunit b
MGPTRRRRTHGHLTLVVDNHPTQRYVARARLPLDGLHPLIAARRERRSVKARLLYTVSQDGVGSMEIMPDPLLASLLAMPFLATMAALHFILYKPLLAYLEARDTAVHGARHEAASLGEQNASSLAELERKTAEAQAAVGAIRREARSRANEAEAKILAAARAQAAEKTDAALVQIKSDKQAAASVMQRLAVDLANDVAGRVLGRSVQAQA